jgi:hypothetical protein
VEVQVPVLEQMDCCLRRRHLCFPLAYPLEDSLIFAFDPVTGSAMASLAPGFWSQRN